LSIRFVNDEEEAEIMTDKEIVERVKEFAELYSEIHHERKHSKDLHVADTLFSNGYSRALDNVLEIIEGKRK
jgi:hypothetical protein